MVYVVLIAGFFLLIVGANALVHGSIGFSEKKNLSDIYTGMTVVAASTSVPICAAGIFDALRGTNQEMVNNVAGANIFNLLVVFGISMMLFSFQVEKKLFQREFPFMIFVEILLLYMSADYLLHGKYANSTLSHTDGVILLFLFCIFVGFTVKNIRIENPGNKEKGGNEVSALPEGNTAGSCQRDILFILLGAVMLKIGSDIVISCEPGISGLFGKNKETALFFVKTVGFNLPCFMTCMAAAKKEHMGIVFGNVTGSNIINILFAMGISSLISPVSLMRNYVYSLIILCLVNILVWAFFYQGRKPGRLHGCAMAALYVAYLVFQFSSLTTEP